MINGWRYYNHALLPSTAPHQEPNIETLRDNNIWKNGVFFIRYTTDFDCGRETEWWYLIKDDKLDISKLKAKRRYEITSGLKNCEIRRISPKEYSEQIYDVYNASVQSYKATGQAIKQESFIAQCIKHDKDVEIEYYAAFVKENGELAGYALNHVFGDYVNFTTMKFMPKYLSKKVSAALIYTMLIEYLNMQNKKYVNDGERSVRHATNFQDYLIKYFGFRKAYCKLNIQYRPIVKMAIKVLYPFRKLIKKFTSNQVLNNVNALLDMEVIRRSFKKQI